jgi:hypothetical protein
VPRATDGERAALLRASGHLLTENCRAVADALEREHAVELQPVDALMARLAETNGVLRDGSNQAVALLTDMDAIVRELARGTMRA